MELFTKRLAGGNSGLDNEGSGPFDDAQLFGETIAGLWTGMGCDWQPEIVIVIMVTINKNAGSFIKPSLYKLCHRA